MNAGPGTGRPDRRRERRSVPRRAIERWEGEGGRLVTPARAPHGAGAPAGAMPGRRIVAALRERLLARRAALEADIRAQRAVEAGAQPEATGFEVRDVADDALAREQSALRLAIVGREAGALAAVEQALGRIAAGEYGVCIECGAAIEPTRLEAQPDAVRCLDCQARAEAARPPV